MKWKSLIILIGILFVFIAACILLFTAACRPQNGHCRRVTGIFRAFFPGTLAATQPRSHAFPVRNNNSVDSVDLDLPPWRNPVSDIFCHFFCSCQSDEVISHYFDPGCWVDFVCKVCFGLEKRSGSTEVAFLAPCAEYFVVDDSSSDNLHRAMAWHVGKTGGRVIKSLWGCV